MKPEIKPKEVYRISERDTGNPVGSYSRAYHDEYEFDSAEKARTANCHGMFEDTQKYRIDKYRVTYELIEENV
jgi:mRNA-degrading endonuclease RelE of RelBE toxin-antitoxin system